MRILYVENHARFAAIVTGQFLARHEVTVVPSLAGARAALAGGSYDLLLVDYDLDDGKGAELVQELSSRAERPRMIAVSSHETGNQALLKAGADTVCPKTRFSEIQSAIERATGRS